VFVFGIFPLVIIGMKDMNTKYILGVDIGNTKTLYALARSDGTVIRVLRGLGTNYQEIGDGEMASRLRHSFEKIVQSADISLQNIVSIYYGAAGADTPTDFQILQKAFERVTPGIPFHFENDGWIALYSGTKGQPGMVVTCGTGNTNFAVNAKGERMRIGGLSEFLGDVLGAYSIAAYAVGTAVRSEDGREHPTILSDKIPKALNVASNADVINLDMNSDLVKKVVETFFAAAQQGDGRSLEICWMLVKEVLNIVREFYSGLFQEEESFKLVLDGTVFRKKYQPLTTMLELALKQKYNVDIIVPDYDPVIGALFLAFKHTGSSLESQHVDRIINTYKAVEIME
jgi:N-acetylglucosamine kinase-like BadF-type ATPase